MPSRARDAGLHNEPRAGRDAGITGKFPALLASRRRAEAATPVEAAAALIELALYESHAPVEALSGSLARMARLLHGEGSSGLRTRAPAGPATAEYARQREQLAQDIAVCVESLQFHDRLTQQLTQVRNLLASLAAEEVSTDAAGRPVPRDQQSWQALLENLRGRFTSDSHRTLFNLLLPGSGAHSALPALHANEGSVELF
ncbi:MAG: hypothetical protein JWN85_3413 [Gammaproteobacteria bacterium]|nr:hypothetical protein [Gammaproteobacteria bacterium]